MPAVRNAESTSSERVIHDTRVDHVDHPVVVGVPVAPVVGTRVRGSGGISAVHNQTNVSNRSTNNSTNVIVVSDDTNDIDVDIDVDEGDE